ncbi:hypothetical protein DL95DRAFT_365708 [Leptodontidium sp. 2 PMI_412]|nr:hypothetical protein DL95DRAFT_365708 [Leptodontidium sp. 2 PMI_412]
MPPDRGRASKACTVCRKQKTRCYESGRPGDSSRLERTVERLAERLGDDPLNTAENHVPNSSAANVRNDDGFTVFQYQSSIVPGDVNVDMSTEGPVFVIRDAAAEVGMDQHDRRLAGSSLLEVGAVVIARGLITVEQASFPEHYGRWVAFKDVPVNELLKTVRNSPLLLCACCLIAVRHTTDELASSVAPQMFEGAKSLFSKALLTVPQTFDFFQATVILSMWSTTIGQVLLSVDSWLSSGFALQHSLASDVFKPVNQESLQVTRQNIGYLSVWNNLCLTHLHYSVGTKRRPLLQKGQIDRCRLVLDSDHSTNFECRIVAEVHLYWDIYESCFGSSIDLPAIQSVLCDWKNEWEFLFDQPRSQFLQMGFHFAQLLAFDHSLNSRSAAVRESLLLEMVRLSAAILNLAMESADARTRHLSDHIYHVITFAAVTLCRLLHLYEDQLSSSHDILELDQLLLNLVTWLYSIGLPCHVAHTLGNVVAAFHKKLRPTARPTPSQEEADFWGQPEFANFFPDLLGTAIYDGTDYTMLPDWERFISGPST